MSSFLVGNCYLILSMLCSASGHVLFKGVVNETGPLDLNRTLVQLLSPAGGRVFRCAAAGVLLVAGFVLWTLSLSRLNISYAYPVACGSVVLVAVLGVLLLNETVTARMWGGSILIILGTMLVVPAR